MTVAFASLGAPSYFVPKASVSNRVDYRPSLMRDFLGKVQKPVGAVADKVMASFLPIFTQWDSISGSPLMSEYESALDAISRYRDFPSNWSEVDAVTPSTEQIHAAQKGLLQLFMAGVPAPKMMLLDEGVIGAFWRSGDKYISIDFYLDDECPWTLVQNGELLSGTCSTGGLPQTLRNAIEA